jgi:hypothetical protein
VTLLEIQIGRSDYNQKRGARLVLLGLGMEIASCRVTGWNFTASWLDRVIYMYFFDSLFPK